MVMIVVMPQFSKGKPITIYLYICIDFSHLEFSSSLNSIGVAVFCMGEMSRKRVAVRGLSSKC